MKPLRQANAVDAFSAAAAKPAASESASDEPEKKSEKPAPEKP
jgi:hypothetical protein